MNRQLRFALALLFLSSLCTSPLYADDEFEASPPTSDKSAKANAEEKVEKNEKNQPDTITVETEQLTIDVTVDGVFEPIHSAPVVIRPEAWSQFSVLSAVEHGRRVKKGQTLIKFDTKDIDLAIESAERAKASSQLALKQAEAALKLAEKSLPKALAVAKRSAKESAENLKYFQDVSRAQSIKEIERSVDSTRNALMYQNEELEQLEKMYAADDLTEETEEIILIRARNSVKAYEFMLERALLEREQFLKTTLPRRSANAVYQNDLSQLSFEQAKSTLPASVTQQTLSIDELRSGYGQADRKLARLQRDREQLTVRAPANGIVYYGKTTRGKWPQVSTIAAMLVEGGSAKPNTVLMTIVDDSKLRVSTAIAEDKLSSVSKGNPATITPKAFSDQKLKGKLADVAAVPYTDGKFDATVMLSDGARPKRVMPGMNCKVAITVYDRPNAILLPATAVAKSDDGAAEYVYLATEKGQKKRNVRIGQTKDDRMEITKGLSVGDKVVASNPDKKADDSKSSATGK